VALQAAAKVAGFALVGAVLACEQQPPPVTASTATTTNGGGTASSSANAPAGSTPTPGAACTVSDPPHATAGELACCKERLTPAIAAGHLRVEDHGACCGAVVYENEARTPPTQSFPGREACCSLAWGNPGAFEWEHTYSCTPWGPPVPPEMDAVS